MNGVEHYTVYYYPLYTMSRRVFKFGEGGAEKFTATPGGKVPRQA